ncbi:MAG: SCO family protein [Anaerolineae bacterium]|nr:SCO family protein [Anaerolineae bacterium]
MSASARSRSLPSVTLLAAALSLLALVALAGCTTIEDLATRPTMTPILPSGTRLDPPSDLPEITLTGFAGEPVSLSDFQGKPTLVYFGYTYCPDVCPLTLADFARVARLLGDHIEDVAFVFISVDPARDTPERLAAYIPAFDEHFIGLTPSDDEAALQTATQAFGVYYEYETVENTAAGYLVAHTSSSFLLDPTGRLAVVYGYQMPPEVIAADMGQMLTEE